jgi:uncharacterized protein YjbI with pentapeptide repeats
MERAELDEAYLEGTSFVGAQLEGANFSGAPLKGAFFSDAQLIRRGELRKSASR